MSICLKRCITPLGMLLALYFSACGVKENSDSKDFRNLIYVDEVHNDKELYTADSIYFTGDSESALVRYKLKSDNFKSRYAHYRLLMCYTELGRQEESDSLYQTLRDQTESDSFLIFTRNLALEDYFFRFYPRKCDIRRLQDLKPFGLNSYYQTILFNKIGRYYLNVHFDLDSAWHYYQSSWSKRSEFTTLCDAGTLEALSELCTYKRKNLLAIGYANRMADFGKYYFEPGGKLKCEAYTNRAYMLFRDGDMQASLADLNDALLLTDSIRYPDLHQEVLKTGLVLNIIKGDSTVTHKFLLRLENSIKTEGKDYINFNRFTGRLAEESGQSMQVIDLMQKALLYESESGYDKVAVVSNLCHILSYAYESRKDFNKALDMMAKSRNSNQVFEIEKFLEFVRNEKLYSFVPALRSAEIYFHKYREEKILNDLVNAEQLIAIIDSLMPAQWKVGEENAILQFYLETGADFYKLAIRIYFELYKKTGESHWENLFFRYCEKNKNSLMVRDYLLARKYAAVPEKWTAKERYLKIKIKEAQLNGLRNNMEFVKIIDEYEALEGFLEKNFPVYLENPLIRQDISKTEMQHKLNSDQTIIHFNEVENQLFTGILTKQNSYIYKVHSDETLLKQMDSIIAHHKGELNINIVGYQRLGHVVFRKLFDPTAQKMLKNQWVIIPDGNLFRFPLAGLITEKIASPSRMEDLSMVLYTYNLTYVPAVRIMDDSMIQTDSDNKSVAVFAFSDKSTILKQHKNRMSELPGTLTEARKMKKLYPGARIFTGTDATKENFLKVYSDPSIRYIHLAVHGLANSIVRDDVKLYFRTSYGGIDSLYGYELLTKRSSVKKVVLSACQSGLGSYQKGEGTYSLPRYFIINGATDVTASLWDLDDRYDPTKPNVGMVRWGW